MNRKTYDERSVKVQDHTLSLHLGDEHNNNNILRFYR